MPGPLDTMIYGYRTILSGAIALLQRSQLVFDPVTFRIDDDPITKSTKVTAIGGTTPGGSDTQAQYNSEGAFAGTPNLTVEDDELVHRGTPQHRETEAEFRANDAYGFARSKWSTVQSTAATDTTLMSINVPLALGDCDITVAWEVTCRSTAGGGNLARKTVFRRDGGVMSIINDTDHGLPGDLTIGADMHADAVDNENVSLVGNAPDATALNWTTSAHVQVAIEPA